MLLALSLLPGGHARAAGLGDTLSGWFWTPDQQGSRLFAAHSYPEAAEAFADPSWRAAALFRAGKYTEAAEVLAPIQTSVAQYDRGIALVRGRDYAGAQSAFEAALELDPGNAAAAHNLDVTKRIIAYLSEAREASDEDEQSLPPDSTVDDLSGDEGKLARIDAGSQLSEDSADAWMRSVETRPADFLKSRFAIEAAHAMPPVNDD